MTGLGGNDEDWGRVIDDVAGAVDEVVASGKAWDVAAADDEAMALAVMSSTSFWMSTLSEPSWLCTADVGVAAAAALRSDASPFI
jgi:hypothetical protein